MYFEVESNVSLVPIPSFYSIFLLNREVLNSYKIDYSEFGPRISACIPLNQNTPGTTRTFDPLLRSRFHPDCERQMVSVASDSSSCGQPVAICGTVLNLDAFISYKIDYILNYNHTIRTDRPAPVTFSSKPCKKVLRDKTADQYPICPFYFRGARVSSPPW